MRGLCTLALIAVVVVALLVAATASARGPNDGYIGCSDSDNCVPFDLDTHATGVAIPILPEGNYPYDATMTPDGNEVWIVGASGDAVAVVDVATNTVTHRIPVNDYPNSVCFSDDASIAVVSSRSDNVITIIDTSTYTVTGTLDVTTGSGGIHDGPGNIALDPVSKNIYAIDWDADDIFEIAPDASSVLRTAVIGSGIWQLVVDPAGEYIYVTDRDTDQVRVIDRATLTEVTTIDVGDDPWGIDVTLDGSQLVVACEDNSSVYVIDTDDWEATQIFLEADADPRDVDIRDEQGYAYVAGGKLISASDTYVYVIEPITYSLKSSFHVGFGSNANVIAVQEQMTSWNTGIDEPEVASGIELRCHPNPFNPRTTVRYHLTEAVSVELAVHDVAGRLVAVLDRGERVAGDHTATWDGMTVGGTPAATGVYFVRLDAGGATRTVKAALLK